MKKRVQKKKNSVICRKIRMARRRGRVGIGHGLNIKFFKLPKEETQYWQYVARLQCQQQKKSSTG
jgi:hypothetical protein